MTEELLPEWTTGKTETGRREEKSKKREHQQHTTWEQWSLWDQFGSTGDIIQVALMDVITDHYDISVGMFRVSTRILTQLTTCTPGF